MAETRTLPRETVNGIAMVGRIVTLGDEQFKIHSVEGRDWYAFDDQGMTTVDLQMTVASWITEPVATIIPSGHAIGEGFSQTVPLAKVRPGVCLSKRYV